MIVAVGKGHQGSAVSLPATGFDGGSTLVFNICSVEVAVRQGKGQSENFVPGSHRLLPLPQGQ